MGNVQLHRGSGDITSGIPAVINTITKKNANIVNIQDTKKLLTYTQKRTADCLASDECMIWTLEDFT